VLIRSAGIFWMATRSRVRFARNDLQVPERMQGQQVFSGKSVTSRRQAQVALPCIGRHNGLIDRDRIRGIPDGERT